MEECYNPLDAARASDLVCSRMPHKVDVGAFMSNKVLLHCPRREFVALCMALFWDMDPSWLAKCVESIEVRNWVKNVPELKQQLTCNKATY
jgi:hypothetical protein